MFLKDTKQFRLKVNRSVANLIQKDGSFSCYCKASLSIFQRSRERAFYVTEEFRFKQGTREGGTVDRYERLVRASTLGMNRPGHQLLAGARFAHQQHAGLCVGHPAHQVEDRLHAARPADQVFEPVTAAELRTELDRGAHLANRRFQPYLIAVDQPLLPPDRLVEQDAVGIGVFADLVDPRVLVAEAAVDVRELEMDRDQIVLAALVRGQRRKLSRSLFARLPSGVADPVMRLCVVLRLAILLNRSRSPQILPAIEVSDDWSEMELAFPAGWTDAHPLTQADLEQEATYLSGLGIELQVVEIVEPGSGRSAAVPATVSASEEGRRGP